MNVRTVQRARDLPHKNTSMVCIFRRRPRGFGSPASAFLPQRKTLGAGEQSVRNAGRIAGKGFSTVQRVKVAMDVAA